MSRTRLACARRNIPPALCLAAVLLGIGAACGSAGSKSNQAVVAQDSRGKPREAGSHLQSDTHTTPGATPTVVSMMPVDNATGVVMNTTVSATFNQSMDPATISSSTFQVVHGVRTMTGTYAYDSTARSATFTPASPFVASTTYEVHLTGMKDTAGTVLPDQSWSFTTGAQ